MRRGLMHANRNYGACPNAQLIAVPDERPLERLALQLITQWEQLECRETSHRPDLVQFPAHEGALCAEDGNTRSGGGFEITIWCGAEVSARPVRQ
jgi:hypothetical protein